jgi:heptosyltransferase II
VTERVLVRAPNWLGDAVLSLPALRDVRRNLPEARIEVLARGWLAELYRAVEAVDGVRESTTWREDARAVCGQFDLAILFPNSFASALVPFLARIPERWGYATDGRALLLTRRARVPAEVRGWSEMYYYRAMLGGMGLRVSAAPDATLRCPAEWSARGRAILGEGHFIGMNPGAFYGSAKRWPADRFAAAGDRLARRTGARIALVGSAQERPIAEAIAEAMDPRPAVLCGSTTMSELIGVLSQLRLLVTNDSGPMHVAAALGTPVVAVFGPTDWRETAPVARRSRVVREPVDCAPCKLRECPIDHRCMQRVPPERVADEAVALLAEEGA